MCRGINPNLSRPPIDAALGDALLCGLPADPAVADHKARPSPPQEAFAAAVSPIIPATMRRSSRWTLQRFDLQDQIYDGVASCLWTAVDRPSGITVVLKLYRKEKLSELGRCQVEREINIHMGLSHQNIIQLYAAFEDEENVVLVLEHADGGDLFHAVKGSPGAKFDERMTAEEIIAPFLKALDYMHDMDIVHRDIKPENIFLNTDGQLKMGDFGLAIDTTEERPVTRLGTLDYMAPEVLVCPDKTSPRQNKNRADLAYTTQVDVWAVGVLTYELLVGTAPFEKSTRPATYENIMGGEPEFPACMSKAARSFIKAALCKNPAKRASIKELLEHPWLSDGEEALAAEQQQQQQEEPAWVPAPAFKMQRSMSKGLLDPFVADVLTADLICQFSPKPPQGQRSPLKQSGVLSDDSCLSPAPRSRHDLLRAKSINRVNEAKAQEQAPKKDLPSAASAKFAKYSSIFSKMWLHGKDAKAAAPSTPGSPMLYSTSAALSSPQMVRPSLNRASRAGPVSLPTVGAGSVAEYLLRRANSEVENDLTSGLGGLARVASRRLLDPLPARA